MNLYELLGYEEKDIVAYPEWVLYDPYPVRFLQYQLVKQ